MNRTQKFFYNSITTGFYQFVVMIVGFITPRVMLKCYGSEINGLVSSITQFISYFNLVEAGLAGAAIYSLYKPLADNNYNEVNGVICAAKKFYTLSGYIFISLVFMLALFYPMFISTNVLSPINICFLVIVLGISGALEFFTLSKYRVLLTADQKTYVISLASTVHIFLNTIIIVFLANLRVNIVVLRAIALTSVYLRSLILMVYVKKKYKYINFKVKPNNAALDKRWDALYLQALGSVQTGAPVILATIFTNLKMVSVYSIFNMIMTGINGLLGIFMSGLSASFGEVIAKKEINILQKAYKEFEFSYYCLITIIYSVALVTIMPFIRIYTKGIVDINYDIPIIGFLFILNGLLYNVKTPQGMLVIAAGMYKETRLQTSIQGILVVCLGAILGKKYGIIGILIASCISNFYRVIDLLIFIPRNLTKLPIFRSFERVTRIIVAVLIISITCSWMNIKINNVYHWVIFAILVTIYSTVITITLSYIFEKQQLINIINRVRHMIGIK